MNDMVALGARAIQQLVSPEQAEIALLKEEQPLCPLVHHFGPGVAIRELFMQAGMLMVGHRQKYEHLCLLLEGELLVKLEEADEPIHLMSPALFVAKPGRKIMFALEDAVFQNIYATELKDGDAVEDYFIDKSEVFREDEKMKFSMEQIKRAADREDYFRFLVQLGMNHDEFRAIVEDNTDLLPVESGITRLAPSPIEGLGLYATCPIPAGTVIMPALVNKMRTQAGRFVNHSVTPNCEMVKRPNGDVDLVALEDLHGCIGGNAGQELTVDYRHLFAFIKDLEV